MNALNKTVRFVFIFILLVQLFGCSAKKNNVVINAGKISVEINENLYTRITTIYAPNNKLTNNFRPSDYLITTKDTIKDFHLEKVERKRKSAYTEYIISGISVKPKKIGKTYSIKIYNDFPEFVFFKTFYANLSDSLVTVKAWVANDYLIPQKDTNQVFWSYQGATYEERPDWVMPVRNGYKRKNYMGMNASDYGGGIPIVDIWSENFGIGIGHVETVPKLVSLPVVRDEKIGGTEIKITYENEKQLNKGDTLATFETFVTAHKGDYFHTLRRYSEFMQKHKGIHFNKIPSTSYEPIWCAWGYEREFTVNQILGTLPEVKKLGYKWVVIDDGWQTAEGDWLLNPKKFPHGEKDIIDFVRKIHKAGLKAKLWWAPLAVDPGTKLIAEHPEMLLLNKNGEPQKISWWDSFYLCPAYEGTLEYTRTLVRKFIEEWKFDGLKIDGQHLNGAPPCYNSAHHHARPEEAVEAMPKFFKTIYDEAVRYNPDAVIEVCPCGTAYNYYMLPYLNQVVASDPTSSWQIRLKGKTFKALLGGSAPYYGDHVELSDTKEDFASTVGVGGIIGTKFVWPVGAHFNKESGDVSLTPAKEKKWRKWMKIYEQNRLPEGEYLGELYDIGFYRPEAHVIKKGDTLYYAFYADKFNGSIELRGLDKNSSYDIIDYVNNVKIATIPANKRILKVSFKKYLLLEAIKSQ